MRGEITLRTFERQKILKKKNSMDIAINTLLTDLENLGEDKDEMEFWRSILEFMTSEQKNELAASLEEEKAKLLKIR